MYSYKTQAFYKRQNEFIEQCLDSMNQSDIMRQNREAHMRREDLKVRIASYGSLVANVILFALQLYTAISSKSLSLFATMADSFMDLLSSATLVYAGWVTRYRSDKTYKYPAGKRRTLGVGIVVFSTLMVGLSIELLIESIRGLTLGKRDQNISIVNIVCVCIAFGVKLAMLIYCWLLRRHPEARIFATDHMNDLILNGFGLMMALLGAHVVWYIDPIGGLLIGLFIMRSWASEALSQAKLLIGATASTQFLNQLTYMAMVHDNRVQYVDTVRAYHIGEEMYVEIDIVMDENTPLYESHDVGEELQVLVEKQEGVQRAHVHIDFDFQHPPEHHPKSQ
ncbi:cation efflux protein [Coemansia spiralis]|nr:cation efflux protein [Coemansia spiralis]